MVCGKANIVATDQSNALMLYLNSTRPERAGQRLSLSSFLGHGCWYGYLASIAAAKQEEAHGICMAPFCHGCISGQAGEEMARSGLPTEAIPCAEWAPDRVCGLEKHFRSSILTSGDQTLWIRRDDFFLGFRVPALSYVPKFSLKGYCWSDGIFAKF